MNKRVYIVDICKDIHKTCDEIKAQVKVFDKVTLVDKYSLVDVLQKLTDIKNQLNDK